MKKETSQYSFSAKLWRWPGENAWYFVTLPKELYVIIREQKGKGLIRVEVTLGKTSWKTSLLPSSAHKEYLLSIKKQVRTKEDLLEGDVVELTFTFL